MKFNFKIQKYQTEAVEAVVKVFNGQRKTDRLSYRRDVGTYKGGMYQQMIVTEEEDGVEFIDPTDDTGYKNSEIELIDEQLLTNLHQLQSQNNIKHMYISKPWSNYMKSMVGANSLSLFRA